MRAVAREQKHLAQRYDAGDFIAVRAHQRRRLRTRHCTDRLAQIRVVLQAARHVEAAGELHELTGAHARQHGHVALAGLQVVGRDGFVRVGADVEIVAPFACLNGVIAEQVVDETIGADRVENAGLAGVVGSGRRGGRGQGDQQREAGTDQVFHDGEYHSLM